MSSGASLACNSFVEDKLPSCSSQKLDSSLDDTAVTADAEINDDVDHVSS